MLDKIGSLIIGASTLIGIGMCIGFVLGEESAKNRAQEQAVKVGVAHYASDENGKVKFEYKKINQN